MPCRQAIRGRLFEKGLAFPEEFGKPALLVGDTVCDSRFVSSARKGGGLLSELSNIVADNRDTFIELYQGRGGHSSFLPEQAVQRQGAPHKASIFSEPPFARLALRRPSGWGMLRRAAAHRWRKT